MSEITRKSSYADLKKWFLVRIDVLPKKLDGGHIYYHDVRFTVEVYFSEIENEIKRFGYNNLKQSPIAEVRKQMLFELYKQLQNKKNWEKEKTVNIFSNKFD
tara:strand:- start:691 stop:996 length:306 start_codon:yes stop_codon:yes gene_type:complete